MSLNIQERDLVTGELKRTIVAGNSNIVDTAIRTDSTWSSKKINDSLVNITDKLEKKADVSDLADKQDFRIFKSLEEFNEKKGTSLTVVSGIDNMKDIANAMSNGEILIIITKCELGSEVYFGLTRDTGWTKMFTFVKSNGLCDVECRTTFPLTLKRVLNSDGVVGDWQQLATKSDLAFKYYPTLETSSLNCNDITDYECIVTANIDTWAELNYPIKDLLLINTHRNAKDGYQEARTYHGERKFIRTMINEVWQSWQELATMDKVANLKLTDFTPNDYSTDEELYKALVSRAFAIGGYKTIEGTILWNNHWYGFVRVFSTNATSGTIEVINHTYQREDIVKVKDDNTVTVETVVNNTSLNSALANCTISTNGNKLIIENSSYTWELTGISK